MNSKNIRKHLKRKLAGWVASISDPEIRKAIEDNTIITGGAIVSLLLGEKPHDYDIYFRTKESLITVAKYYVDQWNSGHDQKASLLWGELLNSVTHMDAGQVKVFIRSEGTAGEQTQDTLPYDSEPPLEDMEDTAVEDARDYRPIFLTGNAITLSDRIQIVTRFYGEVDEIHKNYDFAHCTCSWSSWDNEIKLPEKALECIINRELHYIGSRYPLCSIIRTRKYLERGYHINAGQYVKMCMQLNQLDLSDIEVLEEQLTGVDTTYFQMMINALREQQEGNMEQKVDSTYVMNLIDKLF